VKTRILLVLTLTLLLVPTLFAADFGVRAGRFRDAEDDFVGAEVLFNVGAININPNIEYWLVDNEDVTAGTANLDVTFDLARLSRVSPYVGAGVGLLYVDDDFGGAETETLGNLIGGLNVNLDVLKPYAQIKYSRSLESSEGDSDDIALTIGLRF
jgi:hypothetical protein